MTYEEMLNKKQTLDKICFLHKDDEKIITDFSKEFNKELNSCNGAIKIVTDYDADGLTSVYNMGKILNRKGLEYEVIFNNRFDGGYSLPSLNIAKDDLFIILDNGTNEVDYVKNIYEHSGIKPYVIDHHISDNSEIDKYSRILNFKHIKKENVPDYCTAGLTGKIYNTIYSIDFNKQELSQEETEKLRIEKNDVDVITGIGTVADCVAVCNPYDDNRKLITNAFKIMNNAISLEDVKGGTKSERNKQLKFAVSDEIGTFLYLTNKENFGKEANAKVTTRNIQFNIAPVINACGRLDADAPLHLLKSLYGLDNGEGMAEAVMLNEERKAIKQEVLESEEFLNVFNDEYAPINILISEKIPEGVCGIIAGQLCDNGKPSIVVTRTSEGFRGSGRNAEGYPSLYDTCLDTMKDIAISFGGHETACGLSIKEPKDLYKLYDVYKDIEVAYMEENEGILEIPQKGLTSSMLYALEPFGTDNKPPVYEDVVSVAYSFELGRPNWVKFTAKGSNLEYVTFNCGKDITTGTNIAVRGELGLNTYRGKTGVQVQVSETAQVKEKKNEIEFDEPEYE